MVHVSRTVTTLFLTISCLHFCAVNAQIVRCTTEPPSDDTGTLHVPINGRAFYICERQHNNSFERDNWHLLIDNSHMRNHPEVTTTTSSKSSRQPCLFSNNSNCDSMIIILLPRSNKLDNKTIKACTLLNNNVDSSIDLACSSTEIRITIETPNTSTPTTTTQNTPETSNGTQTTTTPESTTVKGQTCTTPDSTTSSPGVTLGQGLPELSIAADSASMYNVLTNSLQTVLLLLLVLNAVCGRKLRRYKTERKSIKDMEEGLNTGESQAEEVHEEIDLSHPTVEIEIQMGNDAQNSSAESSQQHEDVIITNQHTPNNQPDTDSPAAHELYEINDNRYAESGLELQPSIGGVVKINPLINCFGTVKLTTLTTDDT